MYSIQTFKEHSLTMYKFSNQSGTTKLTVCPERGGIITEFAVNGQSVLYLNKDTLFALNQNIRGGIPILFPICGKLDNGQYGWDGVKYQMPNHGFARNLKWEVIDTRTDEDQAAITLSLMSSEETRKVYPFDFEVIFTYTLKGSELLIEQNYFNHTNAPMPIYAGFHPYFSTEMKTFEIESNIDTFIDLNDHTAKPFTGQFNKEQLVSSIILPNTKTQELSFSVSDNYTITMNAGPEFRYYVLWTEAEKDFVCVEPWMAKPDELNRKEELIMIPENESLQTSISIKVK